MHPGVLPEMAKKHGNVFTLRGGTQPVIILSGFETIKEALIKHSEIFAGRPLTPFFKVITKGKGIVFANGHTWKQQRKFGIVTMQKLGKKVLTHQIQAEAQQLVEIFASANGQPFDPSLPIINSTSNVACALVFGRRYSSSDEEFLKLTEIVNYNTEFGGTFSHLLYETFPWLMKHIPWPYKKSFVCVDDLLSYVKKEIEKHRVEPPMEEPQDFINYYLFQMEKSKNDPTSTYDEENLFQCISDIFSAGTDTTAKTLQWALLLLMTHPDIQEKVHKELDDAFGPSQTIGYQDRKKIPYTFALIHEVMRYKCILLTGNPRLSLQDITILGTFIPKGSMIVPDVHSVFSDPKIWETPKKFNPSHFLDKDGKFVDREELVLFGAGSRVCIGKELAKMELITFFSNLLRAFTFKLPEGVKEVSTEPVLGFTLTPQHYKLCAIPRNSET
ncbi:cytochrome P450 2J5-like [Sphaerodactylus townsendi]|uniref:cytochrome P450 2J5-like n=1 Tax=Sphaerodactylus townsendi TaxID=933632 RepID=UPI002026B429|nr:cytochrome P450 2J5-like [Sphaerodactylus townsendi]